MTLNPIDNIISQVFAKVNILINVFKKLKNYFLYHFG